MERLIKVTGKGKISVRPDTIRLNISMEGLRKEYSEAVKASTEDTAALRKVIEKAGLDPKDLKTRRFNVDTEYETNRDKNGNYKKRFLGYKYTHSLNICFPSDNKQLGRVLYELSVSKLSVEFSIQHTVKDPEAVKNELLGKAVEDSVAKATVLAKAAGVSLGKVQTIDYSWGEVEIYSRPMDRMMLADCNVSIGSGSLDIDIEAEDIDIEDTVTVVWEIE